MTRNTNRPTRRVALGLLGFGGVSALAYGGSLGACRFVPRNQPHFFALLGMVPEDAAARHVAALHLAGQPAASLESLVARLGAKPLIAQALGLQCPVARKSLVQEQCRADFAASHVLVTDGLVLSETEVMLCAAAAMVREA